MLDVEGVTIHNDQRKKDSVKDVTFQVHAGEIVCLAGIEGNGQTELVYGLTGLENCRAARLRWTARTSPARASVSARRTA